MNWVGFQGVTFNLDKITHFEIRGSDKKAELDAYLNTGIAERAGQIKPACIIVARGTKAECEKWRMEIITGKHNVMTSLYEPIDSGVCTFCGWDDPSDCFDFHTPGDAPVCHSCAATVLDISIDESPVKEVYGQGDGNRSSGTLRLLDNDGKTLWGKEPNTN